MKTKNGKIVHRNYHWVGEEYVNHKLYREGCMHKWVEWQKVANILFCQERAFQ